MAAPSAHAIAPVATTAVKSSVPTVAQFTVPPSYVMGLGGNFAVGLLQPPGYGIGKRSADAEADPALLYTAAPRRPYTVPPVAPLYEGVCTLYQVP